MHLSNGEIRALQDGELTLEEQRRAEAHLSACAPCRAQAEALLARTERVGRSLTSLSAPPHRPPLSVGAARGRLAAIVESNHKEKESMFSKLFSRSFRPALIGLAIVGLLAVALAFPSVQAIANSFLGLFRVEQISLIPVDPNNLPQQLESSNAFESMITDSVDFQGTGEGFEAASAAEATQHMGAPVLLPDMSSEPKLTVQPGGTVTFNVDLERVNAILAEIGRSDIQLPEELDGKTVTVNVPTSVSASYGDCDYEAAMKSQGFEPEDPHSMSRLPDCTTLVQMLSPTVEAPEGLNVTQLGEAYLQLMGMSQEEAAAFAQNIDWTTTFVMPIPASDVNFKDVQVMGVKGTLIQGLGRTGQTPYMLIWVKDGVLYGLSGKGTDQAAIRLADSLQ